MGHVVTRTRVHLPHLRKAIQWQAVRGPDKSRPQPPMDKCDLALDKATHKDIVAVADRSRYREDLVAFRMRPPATPNSLSSNDLSKRRDWPVRGFEDDTVLTNESESLECSHRHVVFRRPNNSYSRARRLQPAGSATMTLQRQALGKLGESLAVDELERRGYAIVARRYRTRHGEIDIVADDGDTLVFVEVKARTNDECGLAAEGVTRWKQRQLASMAEEYLARNDVVNRPCRFDVVAIDDADTYPVLTVYRDAFDATR